MMTFATMTSIPLTSVITFPALATFLGWFLAIAMLLGVGGLISMAIAAHNSTANSRKKGTPVRFRIVSTELAHNKA